MIDVYDNVLEEGSAVVIDNEVQKLRWKYDYSSDPTKPNRHWHIFFGHNKEECHAKGAHWAHTLFEIFMNKFDFVKKYNIEGYERIYCNAHTHGIEPSMHIDDGDFTMIYYPNLNWKIEWAGGTLVDGQLINNQGNRLIVFDAHLPHQAQAISRECYELRTCVVFKCNIEEDK